MCFRANIHITKEKHISKEENKMLNRENTYFKELEEAGEEYEAKKDALDEKKKDLVEKYGYGSEELPAFYSRHSGLKVDYRMDTPEECARAFHVQQTIGMKGGMLVTNPIPEEYSMDDAVINKAIDEAIDEMNARGIHGKEATPFLLAKVKELTGGDSLDSNIHLVFNNAKVASQIAYCLCRLG